MRWPNWQVFSMDAAHLKGAWNGVMLTLSFKDANNNIVHVAAVCEKENAEAYKYLLQNVMRFHELKGALNNASTSCFTDGHKRSDAALPTVCPLAKDRRCLEHILRNIPPVGDVSALFEF